MWPALLTCNIEKKNFKAQKITTTLSPRGMEELLLKGMAFCSV